MELNCCENQQIKFLIMKHISLQSIHLDLTTNRHLNHCRYFSRDVTQISLMQINKSMSYFVHKNTKIVLNFEYHSSHRFRMPLKTRRVMELFIFVVLLQLKSLPVQRSANPAALPQIFS